MIFNSINSDIRSIELLYLRMIMIIIAKNVYPQNAYINGFLK